MTPPSGDSGPSSPPALPPIGLKALLAAAGEDPFAPLSEKTTRHRLRHGCGAYTYDKGAFLVAAARALAPRRILELGTALGYTALSLAQGAPGSMVETLEGDRTHAELARAEFEAAGFADRIELRFGDFSHLLPQLSPGFDLVFFDGFAPAEGLYREILRLLAPGAVLVSANLSLHSATSARYIEALHDPAVWTTRFIDPEKETAFSVLKPRLLVD